MSSAARRRSARGIHGGGAPAAERDDDGDAGDVVTVDYRFSILAARRSIVDQLSEEQEEVVRSIGFGGVLHLTRYNKLDRHFSAWLCNQLTAAAAAAPAPVFLADGAGTEVPVTARDVHEVLGVPNGERQVVGCPGRGDPAAKERDVAAVRRALGLGDGEALTLQAAEAVVARRHKDATPPPGPMTPAERDAFVVAFLLLLVEHFFAPGSVYRRGKVNEEVFHALAVPAEVHLYDWAEYVLDEFCRCAGRVREQVASRCSKISLSGCLLFLQIFYIDRLDLRAAGCQVPRGVQPRVAAYNYKSLYKLIELDRQPEWPEGGLKLFGKLKFITAKPAPTQMDDFRSTSEDPPPCVHASDDHIKNAKYGKEVTYSLLLVEAEEKPVVQKTSCQTTPKDYPFESETGHTPSCRSPEMKKQHVFGRSQFEMGLVHPQPPMKDAEACFKWLDACCYADDQLKWTWVILEEPAPIRVDGLYIKLSMIRAGELKAEVCNLVMRLYLQLDDQIYQDSGTAEPRWRHFLPAKWSSLALKHGDKICESSLTVRTMFSGQHIAYDVGLCRMIIVPVELEGSWSCYAWDLKEKRLNILDPLLSHSGNNEEAIRLKHSSSAPLLLGALLACLSRYCNSHGYDHQESSPDSWETKILKDLEGMRTF
ncbi:unnamed protein product [Urochloa decumbens]|uniref:Uncharacterized protein n=1 Tax=Urochloa decumbens TaxID=240449 RepID=A0ABC8YTF6_9POAL